jgi:thiol-disulfide isomerase/thioredoxin
VGHARSGRHPARWRYRQPGGTKGADAIRALVAQSVARTPALLPAGKLGDPAPHLELADLNGKKVGLDAFHGRKILLLFWNPHCGFCQRMLNDLQDWDADPPPGAPALVTVSAGTVEDVRAMGLRSPILLDPTGRAGGPFGANGTPMGILIDANGRIASEIAAGAQAVFELAGKRHEFAEAT